MAYTLQKRSCLLREGEEPSKVPEPIPEQVELYFQPVERYPTKLKPGLQTG